VAERVGVIGITPSRDDDFVSRGVTVRITGPYAASDLPGSQLGYFSECGHTGSVTSQEDGIRPDLDDGVVLRGLRLHLLRIAIRIWVLIEELGWKIRFLGDGFLERAEVGTDRAIADYARAELEQLGPEGPAREYNRVARGRLERTWL
jgi:hypothetical protein